MKKINSTLILTFLFYILSAQQQTKNWRFGYGAGLVFNNGGPVADTTGMLYSGEGCATMSDANGNLLFYTNGVTIWNKNNQVMTNGTGLWGDSVFLSSTQAAIIVPQPLSDSLYYVFTTDAQAGYYGGYGGIAYSVIDMSLQNGNGEVTIKNVPLLTPTSEKVTAVKHGNGTDIWIITQQWGTKSKYAWLMTGSGLNPNPVISSVGAVHSSTVIDNLEAIGNMKFSPDGTRLCSTMNGAGIVEIFDFNNVTGQVTNPILLTSADAYSLEFSPDNSRLYGGTVSKLLQWDLTSGSPSQISNSKVIIHNFSATPGLQLGPDCKIYVTELNTALLGVIEDPNQPGLLCNYNHNAISLQGKSAHWGLPNFMTSFFNECNLTSINSTSINASVTAYPNPFTSQLSITVKKQISFKTIFLIKNILGQTVFSGYVDNHSSDSTMTIDLNFLSKGIYLLELNTNGGRYEKKIIKE